jgi:hypothetical protein
MLLEFAVGKVDVDHSMAVFVFGDEDILAGEKILLQIFVKRRPE